MRKPTAFAVIMILLGAADWACRDQAAQSSGKQQKPTTSASTKPAGAKTKPVSANPMGGCAMCHVDIVDELAGSAHLAKDIGCTVCHGPSDGHTKDENNEVKPDRVITREMVDAFCGDCHACTRPNEALLTTQPAAKSKVCIECHDAH